jgi:integrase
MARKSSPWYWPERQGWFTILHGRRHHLGDHPADAPPPQKRKGGWVVPEAIERVFHALLAQPLEATSSLPAKTPVSPASLTVAELFDKYLDWCQRHRAERTFAWYCDHLQNFLDHLGDRAQMVATDLRPFHVIEWTDRHEGWSAAYRRGAIIAVQRSFNWAEELGHVALNPVKRIKKPQAQRRDNPMSAEDFALLLSKVAAGDPFRDLLVFAWHTGCRPQEARLIEPRHVNLAGECIVIPKEEAKGKRRPRVIYLDGPALEIVRRLLSLRRDGMLFRNTHGNPWRAYAICNRFNRLSLAVGMDALREMGITPPPLPRFNSRQYASEAEARAGRIRHNKLLVEHRKQIVKLARQHGRRLAAYDFRHAFCQRLLESGANHLAVAELMGHANGQMVSTVYSHMNRAAAHLKEILRRASGEGASA